MNPRVGSVRHLADVVHEHAATTPTGLAIAHVTDATADGSVHELTYQELDLAARRVAGVLALACRPGDRALLLYPDGADFAAAFLGCLYAGVVAVPSPLPGSYRHQQRRVAAIAADAEPAAVLTAEATRAEVSTFMDAAGLQQTAFVVTSALDAPPVDDPIPTGPDSLALLQYTSGSTGTPKGVMLTQANIAENAAMLVSNFRMSATTKFGAWIPHYHDMGLMGLILPAWYVGSSATIMSPTAFLRRPVRWLEVVDEHDLDWSAAPNFAYDLCARMVTDDQLDGLDLSRWRYAANGSERVQAGTLDAFAERFAPAGFRREALNPCYGLAEATVFVSGTGCRPPVIRRVDEAALGAGTMTPANVPVPTPATRDLVSCGIVRDLDALVVDPEDGTVLPRGRVGELWLRGSSVGAGYWRNPEETERVFNGTTADGRSGYLRTGDLAVIDHDDELYVTGRIKELIIVRGRNIYPQDIEHTIREEIPDFRGLFGAAFGVSSHAGDEMIAVVHEVRPGLKEEQLAQIGGAVKLTVAREIGVLAAAVQLVRRGSVERTTSGKVQRLAIRDAFLRGQHKALWSAVDPEVALTDEDRRGS
ncbi:fatty acyl-AMP ligase [Lentzea sp. NEAU-D13]|uniref:Fatty acyl-AMP ligase n=1 Tax=Lentzea alba TaxID=2714351 RepID=A0A7C9W4X5_9PSEU|nr:fatty acyl-AMP ligase [Lentzea alba]NGY64797.1 fatty acyl-AMP ligase [Lentzea alba]